MNGKKFDFNNKHDLEKIKKRISYSFKRQTGRNEGVEDCTQEVLTRMLEGRHQHATIDQAVIDYLRECRNLKGFRRDHKVEGYPVTNSYEQGEFDNIIGSDPGGAMGDGIDFNTIISMPRHWERAVMILIFKEDYGQAEVANLFGVSEPKVCQWVQRIQKRIQARINQTESNLRRQAEKRMESLLPEKTKRERRRLEQNTFERMEIGQSWSMESFNEACFR